MQKQNHHILQTSVTRLSLWVVLFAAILMMAVLGLLFYQTYQMVEIESQRYAERQLDNTALRVRNYLNEVEVVTRHTEWQVYAHLQPDSLLSFTRHLVNLNPIVNGCSITMEPNFFPQYGRYFSAYSVRQADSVVTQREAPYEYFDKVWYSTPKVRGQAVWVDPFDDTNEGTLAAEGLIASYCKPLFNAQKQIIGVLSTDLSLHRLSCIITADKAFPHSYTFMLGHKGHYFVHPNTAKLVHTTIFDGVDPDKQADVMTLGLDMVNGKRGCHEVVINGERSQVFYCPLPDTDWSLALVCPVNDMFSSYWNMVYMTVPIVVVGLLLLFLFCRITIPRLL